VFSIVNSVNNDEQLRNPIEWCNIQRDIHGSYSFYEKLSVLIYLKIFFIFYSMWIIQYVDS